MNETSGLIYFDGNPWTMNDSGGKPEIYRIDTQTGKIIQKVAIQKASNKDWEDITQDDKHIYVGDFGNNLGNRKDLLIYKIKKKDITDSKKVKLEAEKIRFSFADQKEFGIKNRNHDFDCESVIVFQDDLLVFSKNWVNGKTRMYKIPNQAGHHKVSPVCTYNAEGLVTGADYNKATKELILLGYTDYRPFIYLFQEFDGKSLKQGEIYKIVFTGLDKSQTEGVCFENDDHLYISTERTRSFEQSVFKINLDEIFGRANVEFD